MILAIDIGNTGIAIGFYKDYSICHHCKISSAPHKSTDEYAMLLSTICTQKRIDTAEVEGCVISSVVPPLTELLRQAIENEFSCTPLIITHAFHLLLE